MKYGWVSHHLIQPTLDQKYLEKSPEWSKTQNLNLPHFGNYLHNFDMVLGIISNLERIKSIQEDAHSLRGNTTQFDIRHLRSCSFGTWGASEISLHGYWRMTISELKM